MPRIFFLAASLLLTNTFISFLHAADPAVSTTIVLTPAEKAYLDARDAFIADIHPRFLEPAADVDALGEEDNKVLEKLETLIRPVVGPVYVSGFSGSGRIALETLLPEMGFGDLDALFFQNDTEDLLASSLNLFRLHEPRNQGRALADIALGADGYYTSVFGGDAHYYMTGEIPVDTPPSLQVARAVTIIRMNGDGPAIPDMMVVFTADTERVLIVRSRLSTRLSQIPACQTRWDVTQLTDAYVACWRDELPSHPAFAELKRQAQSLVNRLAAAARGP